MNVQSHKAPLWYRIAFWSLALSLIPATAAAWILLGWQTAIPVGCGITVSLGSLVIYDLETTP